MNTDTLLLDIHDGQHSLNSLYEFPHTTTILKHIFIFMQDRLTPKEAIHHVYKILTIEPAVQYLHYDTGFPTKRMWLKAVWKLNYISWPLVNVKSVKNSSLSQKKLKKATCKYSARGSDTPNL